MFTPLSIVRLEILLQACIVSLTGLGQQCNNITTSAKGQGLQVRGIGTLRETLVMEFVDKFQVYPKRFTLVWWVLKIWNKATLGPLLCNLGVGYHLTDKVICRHQCQVLQEA